MGLLRNFGGMKDGKFFQVVPDYVDLKQKPGFSRLPPPTGWDWLRSALLMKHVWGSPNFVWGAIALAFYIAFPYDLSPNGISAKAPISKEFFNARFPLWFAVTFGYNLFWHVTLYALEWAKRPFLAGRTYNWDKVAHNIFWSTCGIAIWTGFDNVFAFLWATGRLPYMTDAQALGSWQGMLAFAGGFVLVPLWREGHFYFAHRLLHFKPLYAMVHSLHHRNTDIEPFAGLSMHPVEHLYYYACIMPSLLPAALPWISQALAWVSGGVLGKSISLIIPFASPFHFVWNGMHLLLSPGASHSGYEDHMQADAFHYMHHRYFECNYAGFGAAALDVAFGTFVSGFGEREKNSDGKVKAFEDAKSTLRAAPTPDFLAYLAMASASVAVWAYAVCVPGAFAAMLLAVQTVLPAVTAAQLQWALAISAGMGPVAVAMPWASRAGGTSCFDWKQAPVMHWAIGTLVCSVPVTWAALLCF